MSFFDEFTHGVKSAFEAGEKKVNEAVSYQKIKMEINGVNKRIEEIYGRIGREVCRRREEPAYDAFGEEFKRLDELQGALNQLAERLAAAKGNKRCCGCGSFNPSESSFCGKCGRNI